MPPSSPVLPAAPIESEWGPTSALLPEEEANLATVAAVIPYWNAQDVEGVVAHYEDDIVWRNVAMAEVYEGKPAVREFLASLFRALPDLRLDVTFRAPRGRYVAEEYTITGTHEGPMFGLPPSGRPLELHAVSMVQMRNGRFAEDHFYFDAASAMRQMGYFPDARAAYTLPGRVLLGAVSRVVRLRNRS